MHPFELNLLRAKSFPAIARYVKTSDGTKRVFQPGEVMFQDNVESSPAEKQPQHESGKEWCFQYFLVPRDLSQRPEASTGKL